MKKSIIVLCTLSFSSLSFASPHHIVNHLKSSMHNIQVADSKDSLVYGGDDLKQRVSSAGNITYPNSFAIQVG